MTHPLHPIAVREAVQALADNGFDGMAQAMELLLNECMKVERQQALGVGPYQRGEARRGQANGFKPKQLKTRVGPLNLQVPQVRGASFYPTALERGSRSRGDAKCGEEGDEPECRSSPAGRQEIAADPFQRASRRTMTKLPTARSAWSLIGRRRGSSESQKAMFRPICLFD